MLDPEIYRSVLESLPSAVYLVDRERRILLWNRGAEEITGYLRQEVVGRSCREDFLMHCDEGRGCLCGLACPLLETMLDGKPREAEVFLLHKNGHRVPVIVRAVPVRDEGGAILGAVECFEKRTIFLTADPRMRELSRSASLDEQTGLPDSRSSKIRVQAYLKGYSASSARFGVLVVAVDGLEALGHRDGRKAVDKVLQATAQTLAGIMGPNDMIGSWLEDRFLAVVAGCTAPVLEQAAGIMKRLVDMEGVPWWGERIPVKLSMGGTVVQPGDTVDTLVGRAEEALQTNARDTAGSIVIA